MHKKPLGEAQSAPPPGLDRVKIYKMECKANNQSNNWI